MIFWNLIVQSEAWSTLWMKRVKPGTHNRLGGRVRSNPSSWWSGWRRRASTAPGSGWRISCLSSSWCVCCWRGELRPLEWSSKERRDASSLQPHSPAPAAEDSGAEETFWLWRAVKPTVLNCAQWAATGLQLRPPEPIPALFRPPRLFLYSSVYFYHLLISSASVRSILFLSFIVPTFFMKCSLGISNFLEEISSLSYSTVFMYFFALFT